MHGGVCVILDKESATIAEQIWKVSRGVMYHTAYNVLRDPTDTEDAVMDAMERICRNVSKFTDLPPERTRVLAMIYTRNAAIDLYRKRKRQPYPLGDWNPEDTPGAACGDAVLEVEGMFLTELIDRLLDEMPCAMRDVLMLRISFDYSDSEIASALGIRPGTVRTRLHRGREWLKSALSEKGVTVDG